MNTPAAQQTIEQVVRTSYGRLLSMLVARTRDIAAAEDALSDALTSALQQWPVNGIPASPEAWLMHVAGRRLQDLWRHQATRDRRHERLAQSDAEFTESEQAMSLSPDTDRRLELMFVCTHDAIDPAIRPALILQTVLGLDAATISGAMLIAPATLAQRLVRAKTRIRDAGIPFDVPDRSQWPRRLGAIHEAIYGAWTARAHAWGESESPTLAREAIWLASVLRDLVPDDAATAGLLALLLYSESRRAARVRDGVWVPLHEQDLSLWDRELVARAEACLMRASTLGSLDPYQLEAAIQSLHARRLYGEATPWPVVVQLYRALVVMSPTVGAKVALAAALLHAGEADAALATLEPLVETCRQYQPWWAVLYRVQQARGELAAAGESHRVAVGLTTDPAVRAWLLVQAPTA